MSTMTTVSDTIRRFDLPQLPAVGPAGAPTAAGHRHGSKASIDDLAVLGGRPAFSEQLHVGRPNLGNRQRLGRRIDDILDRVWLTNDGPYVKEFERQVAKLAGARHCVAVCNGTMSLQIAARALGMTGEVILPARRISYSLLLSGAVGEIT